MSSSRSSSISQENIGQKWSPTDVRLTARPQLVYTSSLNWFDSDLEYYSDRSEDEHPADEFSPNQKHSLMTLPHEIRDRIFYLVAEPEFWTDEHGRTRIDSGVEHLRRLPIEIRSTVVSIYYRRRYLLIDLPNFEPNPLISKFHDGIKQYTWPSEIHFHDQWNDLSFRTVPGFLSRGDRGATRLKCATHEDIRQLPLHLFKEIVIKIPASQSGDIAQLMMNWNRLRFLGHVLINAVDIDRNRNFRERIVSVNPRKQEIIR